MIDRARLVELLSYCPETGIFTWRANRYRRSCVGHAAGSLNRKDGYVLIGIDKVYYAAHRLAWLYVTGAPPKKSIDHINGLRADNRFCNLRDTDLSTNAQNLRQAKKNSKTGFLGVTQGSGTYKAHIRPPHGKPVYLGAFATAEAAHAAYLAAKRELHQGCTL